ncbi:MAG TPA: hypothetical protein VHP36_04770 [Chitinispirillaceae bacterium]|nr:hypothetical protein [Chitinispirillaceae bacterium]
MISAGLLVISVLAVSTFFWLNLHNKNKSTVIQKAVSTEYKASTHSPARVVEDVVKEVTTEKNSSSGFLDIAYNDMAFNERVSYEVLHTKKVLEMLSRTFSEGIGLRKLEISKFQTVYAVGLGDTKELISQTFNALRRERVELLPKPYSFITSNGKGFRFSVTLKTNFGLDFTDRFQAIDHLVSREYLSDQVKKVVKTARLDNVILNEEPKQLDVQIIGGYRRYDYKIKAECTYKDFVRFVMDLNNEQIPCAFKEISINALAGSTIGVDAEILITVKNN